MISTSIPWWIIRAVNLAAMIVDLWKWGKRAYSSTRVRIRHPAHDD